MKKNKNKNKEKGRDLTKYAASSLKGKPEEKMDASPCPVGVGKSLCVVSGESSRDSSILVDSDSSSHSMETGDPNDPANFAFWASWIGQTKAEENLGKGPVYRGIVEVDGAPILGSFVGGDPFDWNWDGVSARAIESGQRSYLIKSLWAIGEVLTVRMRRDIHVLGVEKRVAPTSSRETDRAKKRASEVKEALLICVGRDRTPLEKVIQRINE